MAENFIPRTDGDFNTWQKHFLQPVSGSPLVYGLTAADVTALTTLQATWQDALDNHEMAQTNARSQRLVKDGARAAYENALRAAIRRVQAFPGMTDDLRALLGITVPDTTPTAAPIPNAVPMLKVDTSERLRHTIAFFQATQDGKGTRAKPKGAKGCAIYRKIGTPPTLVAGAPTDMEFLALDTATPYTVDYGTAEAGKTVYYMGQWMGGPHGDQPGPWSETVEATVVG